MVRSAGPDLGPDYGSPDDETFVAKHCARCLCGAVRYEVCADPVDAKFCHCSICRTLHGAPFQWAAIFHKRDVRLTAGAGHLRFYSSERGEAGRVPPCKVSCGACGTPIADEGRNMWLAFPTLFDFGDPPRVPSAFRPTCHIFYAARVMDVADGLPKWSGHKGASILLCGEGASAGSRPPDGASRGRVTVDGVSPPVSRSGGSACEEDDPQ